MEKIIPISDLQTQAKKYVEQVRETDEIVYSVTSPRTVEVAYIRD
jgi:hypothetical protein